MDGKGWGRSKCVNQSAECNLVEPCTHICRNVLNHFTYFIVQFTDAKHLIWMYFNFSSSLIHCSMAEPFFRLTTCVCA